MHRMRDGCDHSAPVYRSHGARSRVALVCGALAIAAAGVAAAQNPGGSGEALYYFVDDDGVPHFSNVPADARYRLLRKGDPIPLPERSRAAAVAEPATRGQTAAPAVPAPAAVLLDTDADEDDEQDDEDSDGEPGTPPRVRR